MKIHAYLLCVTCKRPVRACVHLYMQIYLLTLLLLLSSLIPRGGTYSSRFFVLPNANCAHTHTVQRPGLPTQFFFSCFPFQFVSFFCCCCCWIFQWARAHSPRLRSSMHTHAILCGWMSVRKFSPELLANGDENKMRKVEKKKCSWMDVCVCGTLDEGILAHVQNSPWAILNSHLLLVYFRFSTVRKSLAIFDWT